MQSLQVMRDVLHRKFKRVFTEEQAEVLSSSICIANTCLLPGVVDDKVVSQAVGHN